MPSRKTRFIFSRRVTSERFRLIINSERRRRRNIVSPPVPYPSCARACLNLRTRETYTLERSPSFNLFPTRARKTTVPKPFALYRDIFQRSLRNASVPRSLYVRRFYARNLPYAKYTYLIIYASGVYFVSNITIVRRNEIILANYWYIDGRSSYFPRPFRASPYFRTWRPNNNNSFPFESRKKSVYSRTLNRSTLRTRHGGVTYRTVFR